MFYKTKLEVEIITVGDEEKIRTLGRLLDEINEETGAYRTKKTQSLALKKFTLEFPGGVVVTDVVGGRADWDFHTKNLTIELTTWLD